MPLKKNYLVRGNALGRIKSVPLQWACVHYAPHRDQEVVESAQRPQQLPIVVIFLACFSIRK